MRKQYVFVIIIFIKLFILFHVVIIKYNEYKINSYIEEIELSNDRIKQKIDEMESLIVYKNTEAYKNKLLKQNQGLKSKKEVFLPLKEEEQYNKYVNSDYSKNYKKIIIDEENKESDEELKVKSMKNFDKWMYFLFTKKDKFLW